MYCEKSHNVIFYQQVVDIKAIWKNLKSSKIQLKSNSDSNYTPKLYLELLATQYAPVSRIYKISMPNAGLQLGRIHRLEVAKNMHLSSHFQDNPGSAMYSFSENKHSEIPVINVTLRIDDENPLFKLDHCEQNGEQL